MSMRYPGGLIASSPVNAAYPSGVWTQAQTQPYAAQNVWMRDQFWPYTTLLLQGNGTNGAQNNTFLDSSTNNFTITRNGNTTQGSFTPYEANGYWSNYFDGSGDSLAVTSATAFDLSADFTVEGWFNFSQINQVSGATVLFSTDVVNRFQINTLASGNVIQFYENSGTASISVSNPIVVGTWNHIALVRTGTTIGLFVNGSRIGSYTSSFSFDVGVLYIGQQTPGYSNHWFNGYASNVRVIKGSGPYDATQSTLTVPTSPLTAITNTSLLTCQSNRFIDNSTNAFAITRNGDTSVQAFQPFPGATTWSGSVLGGSGFFDGSGDWLQTASNSAMAVGTGDFTIDCWVYAISAPSDVGIYEGRDAASSNGITITAFTSTSIRIFAGSALVTASNVNYVGAWCHVAVTRASGTTTLYINGVSAGTSTTSYDGTRNTAIIGAGVYSSNPNPNKFFPGYISNFRLVKGTAVYTGNFTPPSAPTTAITNTSLLLNFTNAGIFDSAMMNDLETVGNAQVSTSVVKYGTGSMAFDGSGDGLYSPDIQSFNFGTGDFTVECWVYKAASSGGDQVIIDARTGNTATPWLVVINNSNQIYFYNGTSYTTSSSMSLTTWTHVAVTRASGTLRIFINGVQGFSGSVTANLDRSGGAKIGFDVNNTAALNGYIDDLRITKGAARYIGNFTPPVARMPQQ